jgi:outer membrane protein assembly factor BamB
VPFLEGTQKDTAAKAMPTIVRPQDRRQVVNRSTVLAYGVSRDLVATDRNTGKELYRVTGTLGAQWSVGRGADRICRWKAGSRFQIYRPRSRRTGWSDWALPLDTVAVAISPDLIAYRQGGRTLISELGGTPVAGSDLPHWTEGFFSSGELVLVQPVEDGKQLAVVVVDARTVQVLWSFRAEKGELNFR